MGEIVILTAVLFIAGVCTIQDAVTVVLLQNTLAHGATGPLGTSAVQRGTTQLVCAVEAVVVAVAHPSLWHASAVATLVEPGRTHVLLYKQIYNYNYERESEREMFYLTTHSTHVIYGYMVSDIWLRTILIMRERVREKCFI